MNLQLLEAMVERPPPRPLTDDYGMEIAGLSDPNLSTERERSPNIPSAASPTAAESPKPAPRPYISRRGSTNYILSLLSPTISTPTDPNGHSPVSGNSPRSANNLSSNPITSGRPPAIIES